MKAPSGLDRKALLLSMIFIVLIILISGGMGVYVLSDASLEDAMIMTRAAFRIEELYRSEVDWPQLIASGRQGMFDRLDRYSSYFMQEQFETMDEELEGGYTGIGVSVVFHEDGLMIMSVREDGPAGEVGLLSGDIIVGADSVSMAGLTGDESVHLLRGREGTAVLIEVYRPVTDELFKVTVTRRRIPFMHIPFAGFTPDNFIYVRLLDFDAGATDDLEDALDSLLGKSDVQARGIILDLRGNPGGLFVESYWTADLFLDKGVFMVGTDGRSRWRDQEHYATDGDVTDGLPLAVIVDRGTASSGEIVAGALQASGRAILVGDTTFGKGLVQGFVRYPDGDGLRLTISRYYFEGPIYLNDFDSVLNDTGHGLVPDYHFDVQRMNPLRRELENSLLLRQFANLHQDEIIAAAETGNLSDAAIEEFISYALDNEFAYTSPRTLLAEDMKLAAQLEDGSSGTMGFIDNVIAASQAEDSNCLRDEREYIAQRLIQIAYERKYGIYETYRQVLVPTRPEIEFASRILAGEK